MQKITVWDGFIRFFHWSLVVLIAVLYFSAENSLMELHFVAGFSLIALIVSRLIWGFIGSDSAKLSALFHTPKAVFQALAGKPQLKPGHNASGSYMVLLFFVLLLTQGISGLMTSDDIMYDGPLVGVVDYSWSELAAAIHKQLFDGILIAIVLHIAAIVIYKLKGKSLLPAMITGKTSESYQHSVKMKNGWIGFAVFVVLISTILYYWGMESITTLLDSF